VRRAHEKVLLRANFCLIIPPHDVLSADMLPKFQTASLPRRAPALPPPGNMARIRPFRRGRRFGLTLYCAHRRRADRREGSSASSRREGWRAVTPIWSIAAAMLLLGAVSVGVAFFLILDFNMPYTGPIRVSPAALDLATAQLDQPRQDPCPPLFASQRRLTMAHYRILSDEEIKAALADLPDWSVKAPNIEATFALKTFRDAIAFIVEIAIEAEVMNHHPEFHNSYNIVSFSFCTHDAGMKITDLDIETARKISALAKRFQGMA
jgi:4a-hydroxytetrahydrobiopterin dehydratase